MTGGRLSQPARAQQPATDLLCPFDLTVDSIARFLNCEIADDPVYDGLELQFFDDSMHGTGMLAFLSRRDDRRVDYYHEPGLRVDPIQLGGGTGAWTEASFELARLEVADDGVVADVRFTDIDGRLVEVHVDDRDGRSRRRAELLAPVSAGIERPDALLLVWLRGFELVHANGSEPTIRIGGRTLSTGRLPGARLHRRHLVKYAAPLCAVKVNRNHDGPLVPVDVATLAAEARGMELAADGAVAALTAEQGEHRARMTFTPPLPDLRALPDNVVTKGRWDVEVQGAALTGGTWSASRDGERVELSVGVDQRWKPGRLPLFMRLVTTVVSVFKRWPTTYRWRGTVTLGPTPTMTSGWERIGSTRGDQYRRATGS